MPDAHDLELARQELRKTESLVAQLQGEEKAATAQLVQLETQLRGLGIAPEDAPAALAQLDAELAKLTMELAEASQILQQALQQ
jgi:chromosome segregation ATPase